MHRDEGQGSLDKPISLGEGASPSPTTIKQVYVGSPLVIPEFRDLNIAELIGGVVEEMGLIPYLPHLQTQHPEDFTISEIDIYHKNMRAIEESLFSIFEVTNPSHGVGMEIEHAHQNYIPFMIIKQRGKKLSKMVIGVMLRKLYFEYQDLDDLRHNLKHYITMFLSKGDSE